MEMAGPPRSSPSLPRRRACLYLRSQHLLAAAAYLRGVNLCGKDVLLSHLGCISCLFVSQTGARAQHFLAAVAYLRGVNLRGFSNPSHPHFHGQLNDNFWHPPGRAESCGANMPQVCYLTRRLADACVAPLLHVANERRRNAIHMSSADMPQVVVRNCPRYARTPAVLLAFRLRIHTLT
jgi:hypothetical protein